MQFGITDGRLWLGLLIQAKRLDLKSHKYRNIKHLVGKEAQRPQIDLLIEQARLKQIDPLYFFYNYSPSPLAAFRWNCGRFPPVRRQLGCTAAHAFAVREVLQRGGAGLPKMSAISLPMKCIVCCPVLSDPDGSLPGRANGVRKMLRSHALDTDDSPPPDVTGPKEEPPPYVRRLLETPADERGRVIEELREKVGPVGTLVVIKERPPEPR